MKTKAKRRTPRKPPYKLLELTLKVVELREQLTETLKEKAAIRDRNGQLYEENQKLNRQIESLISEQKNEAAKKDAMERAMHVDDGELAGPWWKRLWPF